MKNTTPKYHQMMTLIRRWKESGKSIKAFCKDKNIVNSTFHYWYKKLHENKEIFPETAFIKLNPDPIAATPGHFCELFTAKGTRLVFNQPVDVSFLKKLL